jgi:hypothetical protein
MPSSVTNRKLQPKVAGGKNALSLSMEYVFHLLSFCRCSTCAYARILKRASMLIAENLMRIYLITGGN